MIDFAVPHTLAFAFFPQWLMTLKRGFPALKSRLTALNVHDAVLRLTEGHCDLLIAYHHASQPLQLAPERYEMLSLGEETLAPYSRPTARAGRCSACPAAPGVPLPFLSYAAGAYMARLVEQIVKQAPQPPQLDTVYETDMAESLKAMALEGHGLAFLPASSVRKDLRARRLVSAGDGGGWELTMEVRIYRERPAVARVVRPMAAALWEHLRDDNGLTRGADARVAWAAAQTALAPARRLGDHAVTAPGCGCYGRARSAVFLQFTFHRFPNFPAGVFSYEEVIHCRCGLAGCRCRARPGHGHAEEDQGQWFGHDGRARVLGRPELHPGRRQVRRLPRRGLPARSGRHPEVARPAQAGHQVPGR